MCEHETTNRPFPSCPEPLFQCAATCKAKHKNYIKTISNSHANETLYHKDSFVLALILKVSIFKTWKLTY